MRAFHDIQVDSLGGGAARVHHTTNDDNDDGYDDGEVTTWDIDWPGPDGFEKACKQAGTSRVGISGVVVSVFVDGEKR